MLVDGGCPWDSCISPSCPLASSLDPALVVHLLAPLLLAACLMRPGDASGKRLKDGQRVQLCGCWRHAANQPTGQSRNVEGNRAVVDQVTHAPARRPAHSLRLHLTKGWKCPWLGIFLFAYGRLAFVIPLTPSSFCSDTRSRLQALLDPHFLHWFALFTYNSLVRSEDDQVRPFPCFCRLCCVGRNGRG